MTLTTFPTLFTSAVCGRISRRNGPKETGTTGTRVVNYGVVVINTLFLTYIFIFVCCSSSL